VLEINGVGPLWGFWGKKKLQANKKGANLGRTREIKELNQGFKESGNGKIFPESVNARCPIPLGRQLVV